MFKACEVCGREASLYCETHDAFLCASCDRWSERVCSDPTCTFCVGRPERPSECRHTEDHFDMAD